MSRVDALTEQEAASIAAEHGIPEGFAGLMVFRHLLRRPDIASAVSTLLLTLLAGRDLDHRRRELVIMRLGWATKSNYEWTQHWRVAIDWFGLTADELLAVKDWHGADCFDSGDRAVLAAVDDTLADGRISDATWATCRSLFDEAACLELVAAIGTWRTISELARSLEIPLEDGVASWPPDGIAPV